MRRKRFLQSAVAAGLALFFSVWIGSRSSAGPPPEPRFVLGDRLPRIQSAGKISDHLRFVLTQGYTGTDVEILDGQGRFYFYSPTLERLGWNQESDLMLEYLREVRRQNRDRELRLKLELSLNISPLSRLMGRDQGKFAGRVREIPAKDMAQAALDLQEYYDFSALTYEPFRQEIQSFLSLTRHASERKLNLVTASPQLDEYLSGVDDLEKWRIEGPDRFIAQDAWPYALSGENGQWPTTGMGDLTFALAATLNREAWAGAAAGAGFPEFAEHNFLLYRTLQYLPAGYFLRGERDDTYVYDAERFQFARDVKKDILEFRRLTAHRSKKPVANLILSSQSDEDILLSQFIEPVVNALLANGYDLRVSFGRFLQGAEVYYVVNSDEWSSNPAFFDQLLRLMDHQQSHFYGTVIVHPMGEILNSGRWKVLRDMFKIPASEEGWSTQMPEGVQVQGKRLAWKGTVPGSPFGTTMIREEMVRNNFGDVLLSELCENETVALIMKSGSHYLVNGNCLHLEASYFLSKLLGKGFLAPAPVYVTSGRDWTAALAIGDAKLRLKIPALEPAATWRVIRFDSAGRRAEDGLFPGREILEADLKPYELLIVLSQ